MNYSAPPKLTHRPPEQDTPKIHFVDARSSVPNMSRASGTNCGERAENSALLHFFLLNSQSNLNHFTWLRINHKGCSSQKISCYIIPLCPAKNTSYQLTFRLIRLIRCRTPSIIRCLRKVLTKN